MNEIEILILEDGLGGDLYLFSPEVKPGATISFTKKERLDAELEVVFRGGSSPFGDSTFTIPSEQTVADTAIHGHHYVAGIRRMGEDSFIAVFQLAVDDAGLAELGFFVEKIRVVDGSESADIVMQRRASSGALDLKFEVSAINRDVRLVVADPTTDVSERVAIGAGDTQCQRRLELDERLRVHLVSRDSKIQSGGTKTVDIIAEPPGHDD